MDGYLMADMRHFSGPLAMVMFRHVGFNTKTLRKNKAPILCNFFLNFASLREKMSEEQNVQVCDATEVE